MSSGRLTRLFSCVFSCGCMLIGSHAAHAACDNLAPATGQTATCDTTAPNPSPVGVQALAGSSNVTVNVLQGSAITVNAVNAIGLVSQSAATNNGTLTVSGGGRGMFGSGDGNVFTNGATGVIATSGAGTNAIEAASSGNTLINHGTITTLNGSSRGLAVTGVVNNNTLINTGPITTSGPESHGLYVQNGNNSTFINTGTISTAGAAARAIFSVGEFAAITNTGTLVTTGGQSGGTNNNTVFMQGNVNRLTNSGLIEARGADANAVFSNTAGSSFTALIENLPGGQIISQQGPAIRTLNGATTIINAGLIAGNTGSALAMGNGSNTLILQTGSQIVGLADGGAGNNTVRMQGTGVADNPFVNFQNLFVEGTDWTWRGTGTFANVALTSGVLRLENAITGSMSIAPGASLLAGNGFNPSITPPPGGGPITVTNAGIIDLTNGGSPAANSLTIAGNYVGNGGGLALRTVLGGDGSPSDKLVISGGNGSGTTSVAIINQGGAGAATTSDGILVVQTANGGTTTPGAFGLSGVVAAGAHEYFLFRGGVSAGTAENWYLRSALIPGSSAASPPATSAGTNISNVAPPPAGAAPIELFRPEVALYAALPTVTQRLAIATLGTFHQRFGDQALLSDGSQSAGWVRAYGTHAAQKWSGHVSASFDGTIAGAQTGLDLLRLESPSGHIDRAGLFYAFSRADGRIKGFAHGVQDARAGSLEVEGQSAGGYWTHTAPSGWYVDGVVMGSWYTAEPHSDRGVRGSANGTSIATSLEAGVPIALGSALAIEPQAQLIWQRQSFDGFADVFSTVAIGDADALTGRLGVRIPATFLAGETRLSPYLEGNLWHAFSGHHSVAFAVTDIVGAKGRGTAVEVAGGIVAQFGRQVSAYASAGYTASLDDNRRNDITGRLGLRVNWQ
jgi:outer membrane autotransporter protein